MRLRCAAAIVGVALTSSPATTRQFEVKPIAEKKIQRLPAGPSFWRLQDEILQVAATKGEDWVSYMFPKPGQSEPAEKWAYVKKATFDGTPGLIASGLYPQ